MYYGWLHCPNNNLRFACLVVGKNHKHIPQMVVLHGDEYHGRIRKNHRVNKSKQLVWIRIIQDAWILYLYVICFLPVYHIKKRYEKD